MNVYIPCLNPDTGNSQAGSGLEIVSPQSIVAGLVNLAGTAIPVTIGDSILYVNPVTAILAFAINYQFWVNLFGLGETRIDREKAQIADVYTAIFTYLHVAYGVPVRDGHALDFPSDGVQKQFDARPEIAALVPTLMLTAPVVTKDVFAHGVPTQGQLERTVNQFLANASINNWPVQATLDIWNGIVEAGSPDCSADPNRWLHNTLIVRSAAVGAALLQYIPLPVLLDMAVLHDIGDPMLEELIKLWASNQSLVQYVPRITGLPWQSIYTEGRWALPPYGGPLQATVPLLARDHIIPIVDSVSVPAPRYPTFGQGSSTTIPIPQPPPITPAPQPTPTPIPQPPSPVPVPQPPAPIPGPQSPTQPPYSQTQLDYACYIWRLRAGNSPLSGAELQFTSNVAYIDLQNVAGLNPQCHIPLYRQSPNDPAYTTPPGQQQPSPTPTPQPQPDPWSQADLDDACYIARLLVGNSPLTDEERTWLIDKRKLAILGTQINNPQCKLPIFRQSPGGPEVPGPQDCIPLPQPQPIPQPQPPGPVDPIPPGPQPNPQPDPQHPCPPDCQYQINRLGQQIKDCCDELHQHVLPRIIDLETWVWDLEHRVPGPKPPLPFPGEGPNDPTLFPDPPDLPPVPPELPPAYIPPPIPPEVIDCLSNYCDDKLHLPPQDPNAVIGWAFGILCRCGKQAKETAKKLVLDVCQFGQKAWGVMAECWLNANTPAPQVPLVIPPRLQSLSAISDQIDAYLLGSGSTTWDDGIRYAGDLIDGAILGNPQVAEWPYIPNDALPPYIFADPTTDSRIEVPLTEATP